MPGKEIETEILEGRVPLCVVCADSKAVGPPKKGAVKGKKGKKKKKRKDQWDSDESDGPEYPPGIMKVRGEDLVFLFVAGLLSLSLFVTAQYHFFWRKALWSI